MDVNCHRTIWCSLKHTQMVHRLCRVCIYFSGTGCTRCWNSSSLHILLKPGGRLWAGLCTLGAQNSRIPALVKHLFLPFLFSFWFHLGCLISWFETGLILQTWTSYCFHPSHSQQTMLSRETQIRFVKHRRHIQTKGQSIYQKVKERLRVRIPMSVVYEPLSSSKVFTAHSLSYVQRFWKVFRVSLWKP